MRQYGYQLEPAVLHGAAKRRFYFIDYPINLARMFLWQPWAEFKERMGRTPSARRLAHSS